MAVQTPSDFVESFAQAVKEERLRQRLSQKKLAELAGVARTGVIMLEQGTRVPTIYVTKALANALGLSLADLVAAAESSKPSKVKMTRTG